jgi:hypothetical protein
MPGTAVLHEEADHAAERIEVGAVDDRAGLALRGDEADTLQLL